MKKKLPWLNSFQNFINIFLLSLVLTTLLSACGEQAALEENQVDYFIAPSIIPQSTPIIIQTPTNIPLAATEVCENGLSFAADVTIPDGTIVAPGQVIEKIWLVRNTGNCDWGPGFTLQLESGSAMGSEGTYALVPARAGSEVEIRMVFIAPDTPGLQRSYWRAFDPSGESFGTNFYIEIEVDPSFDPSGEETP